MGYIELIIWGVLTTMQRHAKPFQSTAEFHTSNDSFLMFAFLHSSVPVFLILVLANFLSNGIRTL